MFSSKGISGMFVLVALFVGAAGFIATVGCGDGGYATPAADNSELSPAEETATAANKTEQTPAEETGEETTADASPNEAATAEENKERPENKERVVAETGVGVKGRTLDPGGLMTSSARALFRTKERLVFIQVEHALNLFRATDGNFPKSHEQFMAEIIKANNLKLPELPAGAKYVYDPAKGELMVERPRR